MTAEELVKAIKHLKPTADFSFQENDYSTITWHKLEGNAPSIDELQEALKIVQSNEKKQLEMLQLQKVNVEAKLAALGLSIEDLRVLGIG